MKHYYARYNPKGFANTGEYVAFTNKESRDKACQRNNWSIKTRREVEAGLRMEAVLSKYGLYSFNLYLGSENHHEDDKRKWLASECFNSFLLSERNWIDGVSEIPVRL